MPVHLLTLSFTEFCAHVQPGGEFYAIIGGKVRKCRLISRQLSNCGNTKIGVTISYRRGGLKHSRYIPRHDFGDQLGVNFMAFRSRTLAQQHLDLYSEKRTRNGINNMSQPGMI